MLYTQAKQYLIEKLREAGVKTKIMTTQKALTSCRESHLGAVVFDREFYARNGSKKRFRDEKGARHKRRKVLDRSLSFIVTVGDYSDDSVEEIVERFVSGLDDGIYVDGNYTPIIIDGADWVDEEDSILKAKVAVQLSVTFNGGVYKDTDFGQLRRVELTGVEKEKGKETVNGE